jgi:hypothetical protein
MEDHPTIDACMGAEQHSYQAAAEQEDLLRIDYSKR